MTDDGTASGAGAPGARGARGGSAVEGAGRARGLRRGRPRHRGDGRARARCSSRWATCRGPGRCGSPPGRRARTSTRRSPRGASSRTTTSPSCGRGLPASARSQPRPRRIEALRERALNSEAATVAEVAEADEAAARRARTTNRRLRRAWFIAWVLAVAFVLFAVIGVVTVLGWIVPADASAGDPAGEHERPREAAGRDERCDDAAPGSSAPRVPRRRCCGRRPAVVEGARVARGLEGVVARQVHPRGHHHRHDDEHEGRRDPGGRGLAPRAGECDAVSTGVPRKPAP